MNDLTYTDKNLDRIRNIHHGNFLDYLSSAYEVLRKIFSYLSLNDLENVSKAFKKWQPIVETTKKDRTDIESFVLSYKCQPCEMWSEAFFCLTFCLEENNEIDYQLKKYLKDDAQFLVVESRAGVIGTPLDLSEIVQQKMTKYKHPLPSTALATHLRIPNLPEVGIKTFTWYKSLRFKDFRDKFNIPKNKIIKCLLILITLKETNREQKDDFVSFLQTTQSESFAVGGCVVDTFLDDSEKEARTKYIIFYGDKVEAASIVLDHNVTSKNKIEAKVEELKLICPKTDRGVLFVFRCCSRNKIFRQNKIKKEVSKWEGDSIMKCFPSTPIIGCYGYGEFGRKFPDDDISEPQSKISKASDMWEYSFSTSIVYVGFNK